MFLNPDFPWMHAPLDGELMDRQGRHGILEIKTTNIFKAPRGETGRAGSWTNYYRQVLHYLAVTEYDFAVLKAQLKSEWGGELHIEVRHYFIERKRKLRRTSGSCLTQSRGSGTAWSQADVRI